MKLIPVILFLLFCHFGSSQVWEEQPPLPAQGRDDGIAFTLNGYGYVVTGNTGNYAESNLLFQYNPNTKEWTEKSSFEGIARQYTTVFTVQNKAYIVGGYSKAGKGLAEVWCYDAVNDQWDQKNDFPGGWRWGAFSFTLNGKGYFGCGTDTSQTFQDFWEYNPNSDSWLQLADFAGPPRREAVATAAGGFGFAGLGYTEYSTTGFLNDWYIFDPETKLWKKTTDFPGGNLAYAKAETMGDFLVVGTGMDENEIFKSQFWRFNVKDRNWESLLQMPTEGIRGCASFAIGKTVYIVTGLTASYQRSNEMYAIIFPPSNFTFSLFPNPNNGRFHLQTNLGQEPFRVLIYNTQGQLVVSNTVFADYFDFSILNTGVYLLKVMSDSGDSETRRLVIY